VTARSSSSPRRSRGPPPAEEGLLPPSSSPPRTLVLVRHGETDSNAAGRAQGHADVPLNDAGRAQAATLGPVLAAFSPVRLWSSDLVRALETAAYVAAATGLAIESDRCLREYDVGVRSGLTVEEFAARFPEEHAAWLVGDDTLLVPGEETTQQVRERVLPALLACWQSLGPGETGVVVLHGACLKVGLMGMLGWPWELSRSLRGAENCGYTVVSEHPVRGHLVLTSYNEKAVGAVHGPDFATDGRVG
jgi:glucosyl-3-phosphoglycerate phosphatase